MAPKVKEGGAINMARVLLRVPQNDEKGTLNYNSFSSQVSSQQGVLAAMSCPCNEVSCNEMSRNELSPQRVVAATSCLATSCRQRHVVQSVGHNELLCTPSVVSFLEQCAHFGLYGLLWSLLLDKSSCSVALILNIVKYTCTVGSRLSQS